MSHVLYKESKRIYKKALKLKELGMDFDKVIDTECKEFCKILSISEKLNNIYLESKKHELSRNIFFVTIRPPVDINFETFYKYIHKLLTYCFIDSYKLTFEQKCPKGSGHGFHCHMLITPADYIRSKGMLLQKIYDVLKDILNKPAIDIKPTRDIAFFTKYCVEYQSRDDHKIPTKIGDSIWRKNNNLLDMYDESNPCPPRPMDKDDHKTIIKFT